MTSFLLAIPIAFILWIVIGIALWAIDDILNR